MLGLNDFSIDDIRKIAEVMNEKKLERITLKNGESSVTIEGRIKPPHPHGSHEMPPPPMYGMGGMPPFPGSAHQQFDPMPGTVSSVSENAVPSVETQAAHNGNVVKSPIVGTYYASPAPGKPPFVSVGQKVKKGDVIMIIESMKLMNEVQSEFDGTVSEIMAKDGQVVEYDQPIMIIK